MTNSRRVAWLVIVAASLSALLISTRVEGPPRTNEDRVRALSEDFACRGLIEDEVPCRSIEASEIRLLDLGRIGDLNVVEKDAVVGDVLT